uniref:Variant surface glycoprotein 1607 n=1 Tax=Trypanosoma brucei TaxID=5691 RepID=M4T0J9_9TRYP|nr:variant surface glycoprotein 1607 [Trypanosoma brucei]
MSAGTVVLIYILLITASQTRTTSAAESIGLKNTVRQPICKLSEELATLPGFALDQAVQALKAAQTFDVASKRAAIDAGINIGTPLAEKTTLLKDYYARLADRAYSKLLATGVKTQFTAAAKTAYLKGRLDDYLALLAQSTATSNNACLLPGTTNSDAATYTHGKTIGEAACKLTAPDLATKTSTTTELTKDGYKNLIEGAPAGDKHQPVAGGNGNKCKLLSGTTSGYANGISLAGQPKVMAGYITIPTTATGITLETQTTLKDSNSAATAPWYEAFKATKSLTTADVVEFRDEIGDLHSKTTLKETVKALFLADPKAAYTDVTTAIAKIFGDKSDDKCTELENAIDNT